MQRFINFFLVVASLLALLMGFVVICDYYQASIRESVGKWEDGQVECYFTADRRALSCLRKD